MNVQHDGQSALIQGIALFNSADYFQAHEVWEDWWREVTGPEKRIIQGLIQIAVAMHHASTGNSAGAISVMERALRNLESVGDNWRGVSLKRLRTDARHAVQQWKSNQELAAFAIALV